jgi:hypothetical protein
MFQCAFAIALRERWQEEVRVDIHHYHYIFSKYSHGNNFYHNGYEIDKIFANNGLKKASVWNILKTSYYMPNFFLSRVIRKVLPVRKSEFIQGAKDAFCYNKIPMSDATYSYYEGYWMCAKYIEPYRDEVIRAFTFPKFTTRENVAYAQSLASDSSVTIHIRRGDYLKASNVANICTLDYYRKAIAEARKQIPAPVFFVFSNDQNWCMRNLKDEFGDSEVHFVANNKGAESYRDMQLMSLARCNILANSSFSWWGAFLNGRKDQTVYVPYKWMNDRNTDGMYLSSWIKII